ncbi:MAG: serine protease [Phycisphaerales bacterium]|nr:serine protease [Phycisphaerales bacterium]
MGGNSFVCTGALIDENAPGYFPAFFLTADHCLSTQAVADTLNVYWFYQTPSCNGAVPSLGSLPVTSGATLLTGSPIGSGYDHTLLRLSDDARSAQTFSPLGTTTSTPAIGVHHPGGTYKRYAAYNFVSSGPSCGSLPLSQFYWLRWFDGRTEGGSSGSPLFNDSGQIIGQLYGTCSFTGADLNSCTPVTNVNNIYGRVDGSIGSMAPFIVAPGDDAFAPNFSLATAQRLSPGTTTNLVLTSFQDWFYVDVASSFAATFTVNFSWVSTADQRLQLYTPGGVLLQSATPNASGVATLSRSLVPGRYYVRVSRDRGQGGAYTLIIPSDCGPSLVPCIDGTLDAGYGAPLAVQTTATEFGDNTLALTGFANGSELDGGYARIIGPNLFLFFPGNLESNFNKLELFFDSVPGGQNRLIGVDPPFAQNLARMASTTPTNGLRFDPGFEADRYITLQGANDGIEYRMYVDYVEIPTTGAGPLAYLGSTTAASNGSLIGGPDSLGVRAAINNSNIAGVTAGTGASSGAGVNTGIELMIPLSVLGNPTCGIKICAFINGSSYDFVSNQSIAPFPVGTSNPGEPRNVDFGAYAGNQFIAVPIAPAITVTTNPASIVRCPIASGAFTVAATGSTATAWSVESPANSGVYVPLSGTVFTEPSSGLSFAHGGANTSTLTVSNVVLGTHPRVIRLRAGLSNTCSVVNSAPATLTVCFADFDCNGSLTIGDLFTYLNAWFAGDPRCEVNGVGGLTIEDLFAYLNIWFAGCE